MLCLIGRNHVCSSTSKSHVGICRNRKRLVANSNVRVTVEDFCPSLSVAKLSRKTFKSIKELRKKEREEADESWSRG